jgi:2-(1,2-epoxy-1,2-dihydrophenyl)acetyl-CoA isomerase
MNQTQFTDIEVKSEGHLLWVYLNKPEIANAITELMIKELCNVLSHAEKDKNIRVIIISGKGKHFCAGGDVKAMRDKTGMFAGDSTELSRRYREGIQQIPLMIESLTTPVIAMVNGAAIGAGCDISCMADMRVASKNAKFGETFSKLALVPGDGGTFYLSRVVGYAKAMEMILTGDIYSAEDANAFGLVNILCEQDELTIKTKELAMKIASNAPIALAMTKQALKDAENRDLKKNLNMLADFQGITQRTKDHFSALEAVQNKSIPEFQGE